jgi:hypothetical protein
MESRVTSVVKDGERNRKLPACGPEQRSPSAVAVADLRRGGTVRGEPLQERRTAAARRRRDVVHERPPMREGARPANCCAACYQQVKHSGALGVRNSTSTQPVGSVHVDAGP